MTLTIAESSGYLSPVRFKELLERERRFIYPSRGSANFSLNQPLFLAHRQLSSQSGCYVSLRNPTQKLVALFRFTSVTRHNLDCAKPQFFFHSSQLPLSLVPSVQQQHFSPVCRSVRILEFPVITALISFCIFRATALIAPRDLREGDDHRPRVLVDRATTIARLLLGAESVL